MEKGHRRGKFNILSVNLVLFRGNPKNIRVGLSGQNNADSGLFTKNIRAFSELSGGQSAISHHARCFPKFVVVQKIFLSALWQGSLGSSV